MRSPVEKRKEAGKRERKTTTIYNFLSKCRCCVSGRTPLHHGVRGKKRKKNIA
jgi:hypothetical protein